MRSKFKQIAALFLCCSVCQAAKVGIGKDGIDIDAGNMGKFTIGFPEIEVNGNNEKPNEVRMAGAEAKLQYPSGTKVSVSVSGGTASIEFSNPAAGLKKLTTGMFIPFDYHSGGSYQIDQGEKQAFPEEKPGKAQFYQGNAKRVSIINFEGKLLSIDTPPYSYQQFQDNREWGWQIFIWQCFIPFNRDNLVYKFSINQDVSQAKRVILVDKFGQNAQKEFPGKVTSEDELKKDVVDEEAYFSGFKIKGLDRFGGLLNSGPKLGLKKTGFFHVELIRKHWLLVDPDGNAFFQLGLCSFGAGEDFTYTEGREQVYEWLPPRDGEFKNAWHHEQWWSDKAISFYIANVIRKYGKWDANAHMVRQIKRVRSIGFNSNGSWSQNTDESRAMNWADCPSLPLGQWSLGKMVPGVRGVFDPFDAEVVRKVEDGIRESVTPKVNDPLIIGWFLENEQGFEDIPRAIPELGAEHACKRRLVDMLKARYKDIQMFNKAWNLNEVSFDALKSRGLPLSTKQAYADMQEFTGMFLEAYYSIIETAFRKCDKNHMLIGNRWQPGTANNEQLCRIAGKHLDIVSINYYSYGIDKAFVSRLYQWTGGKPQLWSEFHYGSGKDAGCPGRMDVGSQKMRGLAYRNYVEGAASLGFVVGIQWFILIDQPYTGRFFEKYTGENFNIGLFSVADRPYKPMIEEMATANARIYDVLLRGAAPYVFDDPRFNSKSKGNVVQTVDAPHAEGAMKIDGQQDGWPNVPPTLVGGDRLVLGKDAGGSEAAYRLCYNDQNLYLIAQVRDATPMNNQAAGGDIWNGDGVELFIGYEELAKGGALLFTDRHILLSAGEVKGKFPTHIVNVDKQPAIELVVVPTVDGKGYTMEAAIPWSAIGVRPELGKTLLFDLAVDDAEEAGGRVCQLMWNGGARNSSDRSNWGRMKLAR